MFELKLNQKQMTFPLNDACYLQTFPLMRFSRVANDFKPASTKTRNGECGNGNRGTVKTGTIK